MYKSSPINSTHYAKLYPQNGEPVVAIDSVTSFHPVYRCRFDLVGRVVTTSPVRRTTPRPPYTGVSACEVSSNPRSSFRVWSAVRRAAAANLYTTPRPVSSQVVILIQPGELRCLRGATNNVCVRRRAVQFNGSPDTAAADYRAGCGGVTRGPIYEMSYDSLTIILRQCQSYDRLTTDV